MKKLAAALCVAGAAACTGLWVDKGNDFPCDFRAPEAERDKVCAPNEVCGVDNLCRPFHYEGPQFEGRPYLPRFDAGTRLHPGQLDSDVKAVALNGSTNISDDEHTMLVLTAAGGVPRLWMVDRSHPGVVVNDVSQFLNGSSSYLAAALVDNRRAVMVVPGATGELTAAFQLFNGVKTTVRDPPPPLGGTAIADLRDLRTHSGRVFGLRGTPTALAGYDAGVINLAGLFALAPDLVLLDDGGTRGGNLKVHDVAIVSPRAFGLAAGAAPVAVALTEEGFAFVDELGLPNQWKKLAQNASDQSDVATLSGRGSRLRTDPGGRLFAFSNGVGDFSLGPRHALSTWSLVRDGLLNFSVARPWSDCSPCGNGGTIVGITPSTDGQSTVEVLCAGGKGQLSAVRVIGSSAVAPSQQCTTEPLSTPFEVNRLSLAPLRADLTFPPSIDAGVGFDLVQDSSISTGVALGGSRGRVYAGANFSSALPLFLDRLPTSTGAIPLPDGGTALVALTDRFVAARLTPEGFEVFDPLAKTPLKGETVTALAGEAPGWLVLSSGDVLRSAFGTGANGSLEPKAAFGPRLVTSSDAPAPGPYLAEAVNETDGGVRAIVATASDSLYFLRDLGTTQLTDGPNSLPSLRPDMTPEPNSPIRSLALERSVLGTDGINRVRAYVATARNLYLVQYGGTPGRWSATPLVLTGESPVEVWMDHPRGGLGRVGYPSGEIYTLPGAFLLARSLSASGVLDGLDAGAKVAVDDYDNLAGWPVAYTRSGVFSASYDQLADGGLDNKLPDGRLGKPMTWKRVTLADGSEPWLGKPGRLQVLRGPRVGEGTFTEEWTLLVYTPDEVLEAAFATRSNAR